MFEFSKEDIDRIFENESKSPEQLREEMRQQAITFLTRNQECYVAQWILQNPYVNISDYRLKFVYTDDSYTSYTAEMEKIDVQ